MASHRNERLATPISRGIAAGGWIKPTEPPIRVASQSNLPGMPPTPGQQAQVTYFTLSADGRPQQQEKPNNGQ
jgi:hypothetical protein